MSDENDKLRALVIAQQRELERWRPLIQWYSKQGLRAEFNVKTNCLSFFVDQCRLRICPTFATIAYDDDEPISQTPTFEFQNFRLEQTRNCSFLADINGTRQLLLAIDVHEIAVLSYNDGSHRRPIGYSHLALCGRRKFLPIEIEEIKITVTQAIEHWKSRGEITPIKFE